MGGGGAQPVQSLGGSTVPLPPVRSEPLAVEHAVRLPYGHHLRKAVNDKQNICKARQHLMERGLIDFRTGSGIRAPAMYSLTEPYTVQLSPRLSRELTVQLTHSNIKDKETDKDIISNQHAREESLKSLDELESLLLTDTGWQNSVSDMLAKKENGMMDTARIQGYIRDFFREQRIGGLSQREESDCRSHFYHWINKQLKNNRHGTDRKSGDYRDTDVTARSAKDYEGPF